MASLKSEHIVEKGWFFAKFRSKFNSLAAKLSKGIAVPIALLPVAGLLLGISASILTNLSPDSSQWVRTFFEYLKNGGEVVFANLPVLFAVAIALAFSGDAGVAGFTAIVGWATFNALQSSLLKEHVDAATGITYYSALFWNNIPQGGVGRNLGLLSLQSSIFGGILIGSIAAWSYNRFHELKLPSFLGFFGGTRSVPLIMLCLLFPFTIVFVMIWPAFAIGLNYIGIGLGILNQYGNVNSLIFGYIERSLIPFGVHHAFYAPLWYSSVGGEIVLDAPAVLGIYTEGGYGVYKVAGGYVGGNLVKENVENWRDVLALLNPNVDLPTAASASNWQGDNRYFQQLNAYMIGRQLQLEKIWGIKDVPEKLDYFLTYKTFSTSTFNRAAAVGVFSESGDRLAISEISKLAKEGSLTANSFLPAFPSANIGAYQQGKFPFMIFGIPAAAAAMVVAANKEERRQTVATVGSAALTSFLTGITEPFEFTFLFVSPLLFWGFHSFFASISFWLTALLGANIGQTFSGGIIDLIVYGLVPDISLGAMANSYVPILVGIILMPAYFFSFLFMIKKYDLPTPGRGGQLITKEEYKNLKSEEAKFDSNLVVGYKLVKAYGGKDNIESVDACITKLRVTVKDPSKINREKIKACGSSGTVNIYGNYTVAIFGTASDNHKVSMLKIVKNQIDIKALDDFVKRLSDNKVVTQETVNLKKTKKKLSVVQIFAPVAGKILNLDELVDNSFVTLGQGVAIEPKDSNFLAPIKNGELEVIFPTKHAYIFNKEDLKILVHVGIETVKLGQGENKDKSLVEKTFKTKLDLGEVKDLSTNFLNIDWTEVDKLAKDDPKVSRITPIIVLNESLEESRYEVKLKVKSGQEIKANDLLFEVVPIKK